MPDIHVSEDTFKELQARAIPFVDTPESVIRGLLRNSNYSDVSNEKDQNNIFLRTNIPPLTHTKVLYCRFGANEPSKNSWDALLVSALSAVHRHGQSAREVKRISGANIVEGIKRNEGYKFLDEYGFSYQGVSADDAINYVVRCSEYLKSEVLVEFEWRLKEGAYKPGKKGVLKLTY